jgi:hypothetical protein
MFFIIRREYFHNEEREQRVQMERKARKQRAEKAEKLAKNKSVIFRWFKFTF